MNLFSPVARRYFLSQMNSGLGAMALGALMPSAVRADERANDPLAVRKPHFENKAKAVIHLFMAGAPSHLDLFDYKPELAKLEGKPLPDSVITRLALLRVIRSTRIRFSKKSGMESSKRTIFSRYSSPADTACSTRIAWFVLEAGCQKFILSSGNSKDSSMDASK